MIKQISKLQPSALWKQQTKRKYSWDIFLTYGLYQEYVNANSLIKIRPKIWIDSKKRSILIDNKYIRKCSTLLAIKEMQSKTQMRSHYTPTEWLRIKGLTLPDVGKNAE